MGQKEQMKQGETGGSVEEETQAGWTGRKTRRMCIMSISTGEN